MPKWTAAQQVAMQLRGQDVLVSAAAGSGKTATLTERIIRSLTERAPDGTHMGDISRMLIVTFTRSAAAELRSRISAALTKAIAEHPDDRYLYRQLTALGSAQICTIDSFFMGPVRANFERLGLPSSFRIADDKELSPLKKQVMRRCIEQMYRNSATKTPDSAHLLQVLEDNAFVTAMENFLPLRDDDKTEETLQKLYEKLIDFPSGVELLHQNALRLEQQATLPFCESDEGKSIVAALLLQLDGNERDLTHACARLEQSAILSEKYLPSFAHDLSVVSAVRQALQQGDWRGAGDILADYKPCALATVSKKQEVPTFTPLLVELRNDVKKALKDYYDIYLSVSEEQIKAQMQAAATVEHAIYQLLRLYDTTIRQEKVKRAVLDFQDIRRYLCELLLDPDNRPTDVARALSERYDAVYIDEYQDVDAVQDLLFSIVGAGGKRFMVGDIKQSIYLFRGSESSIFSAYRRIFSPTQDSIPVTENKGGTCVFMSDNFRCDPTVIAFTNLICGRIFRACGTHIDYCEEDDLIASKQLPPNYTPTPVQVVLVEKERGNAGESNPEAVYVAQEIHRLLKEGTLASGAPIRPQDIAILMRAKTKAADFTKALHAYGIETTFTPREQLIGHPDMILMSNLLSVIDNPRDDVPLSALLSTPTSPFSLSDLLHVRAQIKAGTLYDAICAIAETEDTTPEPAGIVNATTKARWHAFLDWLSAWRTTANTLSVDKLLRKLYGEPYLSGIASSPALIYLYDLARQKQSQGYCNLYRFMQLLRPLLESPDAPAAAGLQSNTGAVQLMSIHKSKGLEFPVVFLVNCGGKFSLKDVFSSLAFDSTLGVATKTYHPETTEWSTGIPRLAVEAQVRDRLIEEEMRILYVALTRARERLYTVASGYHMEKKMQQVTAIPRDHDYAIKSAGCYLDWILPPLLSHEGELTEEGQPCYELQHIAHDTLSLPYELPSADSDEVPGAREMSEQERFYRQILEDHKTYRDPRALLRHLPTKAAASKLRLAMLDGNWIAEDFDDAYDELSAHPITPFADNDRDGEALLQHRIELMQHAHRTFGELLSGRRTATAADRGTATHLFLQYCSFASLAKHGVQAEIDRLLQKRFLSPQTAQLLNQTQLEQFVGSALLQDILHAKEIWRELHFDRFVPYARLTQNPKLAEALQDATLYVQGSLDLVLRAPDGTLTLCDYKTDRLAGLRATVGDDAQEIRRRLLHDHASQLLVYAEAMQGLFGQLPDRILIYSLTLGESVDLTDDILKPNTQT